MDIYNLTQRIIFVSLIFFQFINPEHTKAQNSIKVGMSAALSGPYQDYGIHMKTGIEAYFKRVNNKGGVNGLPLDIVALDDSYDPQLAKINMKRFVNDKSILAVIGSVGTPTAEATVPIANREKMLLFGLYTGAELLRLSPPDRYVINYRASYEQEINLTINYLLKQGILPYQIAFFTQNDGFGESCYNSAIKALEKHGFYNMDLIIHGRYERNTMDITDALLKIISAPIKPRAIVMAGTSGPCAKFISIAKKYVPNVIFTNVSFVGSSSLKKILGPDAEGIIISQVVPVANAYSKVPIVQEYIDDLKILSPNSTPSFISLEGYIIAKLFVQGLKLTGKNVNRESIIDGILKIQNLDIGLEQKISFAEAMHQGSQKVWLSKISENGFETLEKDD